MTCDDQLIGQIDMDQLIGPINLYHMKSCFEIILNMDAYLTQYIAKPKVRLL